MVPFVWSASAPTFACSPHTFMQRDNLRLFFDKCFPNLLKRVFGYDDFEASWLNLVTKVGAETFLAYSTSKLLYNTPRSNQWLAPQCDMCPPLLPLSQATLLLIHLYSPCRMGRRRMPKPWSASSNRRASCLPPCSAQTPRLSSATSFPWRGQFLGIVDHMRTYSRWRRNELKA